MYGAVRKIRKQMLQREPISKKKGKRKAPPTSGRFNDTMSEVSVSTSVADYKNEMELQYQRKNL